MTVEPIEVEAIEDVELESALAMLWDRHRPNIMERISLLELKTADVLRDVIDDEGIVEGSDAAHKLAGSLGTFGFDAASRAALEAESLLRESTIDGRLLAETVTTLRASIEEVEDLSRTGEGSAGSRATVRPLGGSVALIASVDTGLISRLTAEAAAVGLAMSSTAGLPDLDTLSRNLPTFVLVDDTDDSGWTWTELLDFVASASRLARVVVFSDHEKFDDRVEFAKAGAVGVFARSQNARQTISFLLDVLAERPSVGARVLVLNTGARLYSALEAAQDGFNWNLCVRQYPSGFWEALEEQGADLVVVEDEGAQVSGSELCHVIRAHPRWHQLPIIVVGASDPASVSRAVTAGADDYLGVEMASGEMGIRIQAHIDRNRMVQIRSDIDPLTGTQNRRAMDQSLDRLLRLALRRKDPLAFALIEIDGFTLTCQREGNTLGDVVLHRLGESILACFRGEDVVGRWSDDAFAVGIYGASCEVARTRITELLLSFREEGFPTTSGKLATFTFSAGISSAPIDGSAVSSLERVGETALRRARSVGNCIVVSGERPREDPEDVTDVVIVEDDDSMAEVIEHALHLRHHNFVRFRDGAAAATALGEGSVKAKIVLLDVGLPSLDGFGVLQALREKKVLQHTHVIMLTARSSEAEVLRALSLGASEHLTKPFSIPVLLGRLEQTLARSAG
jgi:diguanylate cyclase (GGDEF)-like protein